MIKLALMHIKEIVDTYDPPGIVALSLALGRSRGAASQWGEKVPDSLVLPLCELLEWKCTPHIVRPDIYPNPGDAMPRLIPAEVIEDRRQQDQRAGDRRALDLFVSPVLAETENPT